MDPDNEIFIEVPVMPALEAFLGTLTPARRDLYVDPVVLTPWACDPERCRPLLGRNLCCKVQTRCRHLVRELCDIHADKPFSCALFPLDLVRIGGARVVTTPANLGFFATGWCRFDRDMLRCFEGLPPGLPSMYAVQRPVLERVFTRSELLLLDRTLEALGSRGPVPQPAPQRGGAP